MFELLANLGTNAAMGFGNVLDGLKDEAIGAGEDIGSAVNDPMSFMSSVSGFDHIKALTQSPEDYKKFLAENPDEVSRFATPAAQLQPMPLGQFQSVPMAPTGGFVNQMPNYLNHAQQSLRGPYG
jgi:hypothetical protein